MPDEEFDSLDAIEKHFGKQRKAAGDDEERVRALTLEEREAKADFREQSAIRRELAVHRKAALAEAKIPDDFHEFVTGDTPEAIDASVAKVKERIDKLTAGRSSDAEGARNLYGSPISGGGTPPGAQPSPDEEWISDFQKRFDDPSAVITVREVEEFARKLGGAHLLHEMAANSRTFQRNGITPEVVAAHENGQLKQQRPAKAGVTAPPRS